MKISLEWLKDYIDVRESPVQLQEDLTMAGLVVESVSQSGENVVFEFEITSNRPDCLSHMGIAREIAALYKRPIKTPPRSNKIDIPIREVPYSVEIRDAELCPRYVGLVLSAVRVGPSPAWMQHRLEDAGMRPVNNIVDITNYVLLELGHPLHAFDFKLLRQGKIIVARATEGQKLVTLDGIERHLDREMLLINDGEGPVAIAGVMGGQNSEISENTDTVLLECAYFKPQSIRRTSRKLGLSTEASFRFERGADWNLTVPAIARACYLIEGLAGGKVTGSLQDVYPAPVDQVTIELSQRRAEALLGVDLPRQFIKSTLRSLNFKMSKTGRDTWMVTCPSYRADMELEADLIEELARFHGYQNIPTTIPPSKSAGLPSPVFAAENAARRLLLGLGYCEAVNLSFAGEDEHKAFPPRSGGRVSILNPLTEDTRHMRTTLAAGLVKSIRHNFNYDNKQVRLFEIGRVYLNGPDPRPLERNTLGIAATGADSASNWVHPGVEYSFFHLKGVITAVLEGMRCEPFNIIAGAQVEWLDPGSACTLIAAGHDVGVLGALHPDLQESFKMRQPVFLAELNFEQLCRHVFQPVRYQPLPRYPAVERDLSIVVSRDAQYGDICRGIEALRLPELSRIDLVDVYVGEKIPPDRISLTLRFTFLDPEKTLTVDRVQGFSDNIVAFLKNRWDADLR